MSTPATRPTAGDLIDAADYAFSHVLLEPRPDPPQALLVLLHGVGGDELQLVSIGERMPAGTLVALPRGPRTISGGRLGWYRIGLSEDGVQVVEDEEAEARAKLADFIAQLQSRFDVAPERTWIGGFSQGGILAASAALDAPSRIAGVFIIAGRLLPDAAPSDMDAMRRLHALIVHGRDDDTLPPDGARDANDRLRASGVHTTLEIVDGGHTLAPAMLDRVVRWLEGHLQGQ